ncbi:MAG TPA: PadR family transcriptional regulator [Mycobacterium sp.]|nr:PadR family transcriptional regulator [Mycobacterium sp.]
MGVKPGGPDLAGTGWALLGMLSGGNELSGYDIKKWSNWVVRFFYQSPAHSQIYSELRKLERLGLVTSRVDHDGGIRSRRLYKITDSGMEAITRWTNEAPYDPPILKHSVLMRITIGHLSQPGKLKELLQEHISYCDAMLREAGTEARWTKQQPAWAYANIALKWAERYYASERELALQLVKDLDEAEAVFATAFDGSDGESPWPMRDYWYEIEKRVKAEEDRND